MCLMQRVLCVCVGMGCGGSEEKSGLRIAPPFILERIINPVSCKLQDGSGEWR